MATPSQTQPNGILSSSTATGPSQSASQPTQNTSMASTSSATIPNTQQSSATAGVNGAAATTTSPSSPTTAAAAANSTTAQAPKPRDARTIELLLTSQGVTSFDSRVPLLLLDFAYRHTSSILSDALHLSSDPYTSHAGARPSASSGAVPQAPPNADATVSANAIAVAIASRQAFQFRGGSGAGGGVGGGGGASKDWLLDLARERNRVALPRVLANEWGVRLPNERFVLSGVGWRLKDRWEEGDPEDEDDDSDDDLDNGEDDAMDGVVGGGDKKNATGERNDSSSAAKQGESLEDLLADDVGDDEDVDME